MENQPKNLIVVPNYDAKNLILLNLAEKGIFSGHFTNGTYAAAKEIVDPTTLAGFQFIADEEEKERQTRAEKGLPPTPGRKPAFFVAVNSDESMKKILLEKTRNNQKTEKCEDEGIRAEKVAISLARQFPDRQIVVVFYNEVTPNALYGFLRCGMTMKTLHKWGYGTNPSAGVIEGAEIFGKTYAFPLPNDQKPLCDGITRKNGQAGKVSVVDLRNIYISVNEVGKSVCLFPLRGEEPRSPEQRTPPSVPRDPAQDSPAP
ncbi:MAG: hypothetical protein WC464_01900 [Bdellovibrionales bacterium]